MSFFSQSYPGTDPKEAKKSEQLLLISKFQLFAAIFAIFVAIAIAYFVGRGFNNSAPVISTSQTTTTSPQETSQQPSSGNAISSSPNNLDLQAQCATQAQKTLENFEVSAGSSFTNFGQQNHYNPAYNECFVVISYNPVVPAGTEISAEDDPATNINTLMDAYENSDLADCYYYANSLSADFSNPDSYTQCTLGSGKVTYQEYKNFVNQRMGAGTVQ